MRALFLLLIGAASALAQPLGFGVKAGVPLTDFFTTVRSENFGFNSRTKHFIIGPSVELRLPFGFGVELDALYRRVGYSGAGSGTVSSATATSWEFPLLGKYRFKGGAMRPFVGAGVAWDSLSGLKQSVASATGLSDTRGKAKGTAGFVMAAGLDIKALVIHIVPEIRYTRWGSSHFEDPLNLIRGNRNQAEVLLGVTF